MQSPSIRSTPTICNPLPSILAMTAFGVGQFTSTPGISAMSLILRALVLL